VHPILFQFGGFTIYTYGVCVALCVISGVWLAAHSAPRYGLPPLKIWNLGIYGILVALITSKLWLILSSWSYYAQNPHELFSAATLESGGAFYGGFLGGVVWTYGYARWEKLPLLPTFDVASPSVALGHAIGRVGCFMAGCCFGKPTTLPWGITFTSEVAARISGTPLNVPLHPTQLYEAFAEFANFLFLYIVGRRWSVPGQVVGAYLILYGTERGLIEFVRDDPGRTPLFNGAMTLMQVVSVAMILAGLTLWSRALRQRTEPLAASQ
jgi:phosphatidylglycerol:prolipoprotein diacylglycerol transferase